METGDATPLATRLPGTRSREIALVALANLAKFEGKYQEFLDIKKRYSLKWSTTNSTQYFQRFFNEELSLEAMLQRIRSMIEKLPPFMARIIRFACLVGLRASECIESVRLLASPEFWKSQYYNPERQALEHFRFPDIFLRATKKAYLSYITKEMLSGIGILDCKTPVPTTTLNSITLACRRRHIPMELNLTRKIFASWLRKEGIAAEVVDLLQGRVSQSILTRHYLAPSQNMKDDVLKALEKLQQQL